MKNIKRPVDDHELSKMALSTIHKWADANRKQFRADLIKRIRLFVDPNAQLLNSGQASTRVRRKSA